MKQSLKKKTDDESNNAYKAIGPLLGIGSQLAITIVVFVFLGKYLDDRNNSFPLWTIILAFGGVVIGLYSFIKTILSLYNKKPKE